MPPAALPPRSAKNRSSWRSGRHPAQHAVAGHHLERAHPVRGEPERAGHRADAAAGRVADDADVTGRTVQRREAMRRGGLDDGLPLHARAHPRPALLGMHRHLVEVARDDQQVTGEGGDGAVPGRLHADGHAVLAGEGDGLDDVCRVAHRDDGSGTHLHREVPGRYQRLVSGFVGFGDRPAEPRPQVVEDLRLSGAVSTTLSTCCMAASRSWAGVWKQLVMRRLSRTCARH